jgi:hypothetical protein
MRKSIQEQDYHFDQNAPPEQQAAVKERWGPGPWQAEPDRVQWWSQGIPCLLIRGPFGQWNGYIGVPVGHPWYETDAPGAEVHGGVTYSGDDSPIIAWQGPEGPSDVRWWIGFDCGHAWDIQPALDATFAAIAAPARYRVENEIYRDLAYARSETEALAAQALNTRSKA